MNKENKVNEKRNYDCIYHYHYHYHHYYYYHYHYHYHYQSVSSVDISSMSTDSSVDTRS